MSKTVEYIKEVRAEIKNVTWPTRNQTVYATIAVLVVSIAVAYYLGFFDFVFQKGLAWLLTK